LYKEFFKGRNTRKELNKEQLELKNNGFR